MNWKKIWSWVRLVVVILGLLLCAYLLFMFAVYAAWTVPN